MKSIEIKERVSPGQVKAAKVRICHPDGSPIKVDETAPIVLPTEGKSDQERAAELKPSKEARIKARRVKKRRDK